MLKVYHIFFICLFIIFIKLMEGMKANNINDLLPVTERVFLRKKRWLLFPKGSALKFTLLFSQKLIALYPKGFDINIEAAIYYPMPSARIDIQSSLPFHYKKNIMNDYTEIKTQNIFESSSANIWRATPHVSADTYSQKWHKWPLLSKSHDYKYDNTRGRDKWYSLKNPQNFNLDCTKQTMQSYNRSCKSYKNLAFYHRQRERRQLFDHFEKFSTVVGIDGKACILRGICESRHLLLPTGYSIAHDVLKIIFSFPLHEDFEDNYREAYNWDYENCISKVQAKCPFSILNILLNKRYY